MSRLRARIFPRRPQGAGAPVTGLTGMPGPAGVARRLEEARGLDRLSGALNGAVRRGLATRGRADALHGVWLGQPVHPALTGLPVGFWTSAAVLDLVPGSERAAKVLIA